MAFSISSNTSFWSNLNPVFIFRDLYRNRGLLWQFTVRNIELRHKGSYLGLMWSIFTPLLLMGLYYFVFGVIFHRTYGVGENDTEIEFALGLFLSLTVFQLVAEALTMAPIVIISSPNLVKKVVFPLSIIPVATMGSALFNFMISLVLFFLGLIFFGSGLSMSDLWLPVIILPLIFLTMGLTWLLASLGVFLRDISHVMQFVTTAILYGSAVFYSTAMIPESIWKYLKFNPLIHVIDASRRILLWDLPIHFNYLFYVYGLGFFFFIFGYAVFQKLKPAFADVM